MTDDKPRDKNDGRHRALIWDRFGGPMPLTDMLGDVLSAKPGKPKDQVEGEVYAPAWRTVYQWAEHDSIPDQYHDALFEAAKANGIALHPADFFDDRWRSGTGRKGKPAKRERKRSDDADEPRPEPDRLGEALSRDDKKKVG